MSKNFVSTQNKGFQMTFANGLTASIQWGAGNYCDNHLSMDFTFSKPAESSCAEIAVWDTRDNWLDPNNFCEGVGGDGMVAGYVSADQVAQFLFNVSQWRG